MKHVIDLSAALDEAIEMWTYLAENPGNAKWDWPAFDTSEARKSVNNCTLCLWSKQDTAEVDCSLCPLTEAGGRSYCSSQGSPFDCWVRSRYALTDSCITTKRQAARATCRDAACDLLEDLIQAKRRLNGL